MIAEPRPPKDVARAIIALRKGVASAGQQRMAMNWILNVLCGVARPSFSADALTMAFMEGHRAVGIVLFDIAGGMPAADEDTHDDASGQRGNEHGAGE